MSDTRYMFYDAEGRPRPAGSLEEVVAVQGDDAKTWQGKAAEALVDIGSLIHACERLLKFNEELCQDVGVSTHYPSADEARRTIATVRRKWGLPAG